MAIRIVLAEDNYLVREGVRRLLETQHDLDVVATCGDLDSLLEAVEAAAAALISRSTATACRTLALYVAAVRAVPPSVLTGAEKAGLVADANRIKAVAGCG